MQEQVDAARSSLVTRRAERPAVSSIPVLIAVIN